MARGFASRPFRQQLFHHGPQAAGVGLAGQALGDAAAAVEEEGQGRIGAAQAEAPGGAAVVLGDAEGQAVGVGVAGHLARLVVDHGHRQGLQAPGLVAAVQLGQFGQGVVAVAAGGGPELQDHHLAAQLGQADAGGAQHLQFNGRGGLPLAEEGQHGAAHCEHGEQQDKLVAPGHHHQEQAMELNTVINRFGGRCIVGILTALVISMPAAAQVSNSEAVSGLKEALTRGAEVAVSQLGKSDGFLGNDKVRIPLPGALEDAAEMMKKFGAGKQADQLVETMNRAAEAAVVEAKPLLVKAVKDMSVKDAQGILGGGDDAATQYFKRSTSEPLAQKFLPIVKKATAKVQLADKYNQFAGKAAKFHLIDAKDANLDDYVTRKALDGLYLIIAEQEKAIRKDPIGTGSKVIGKVFGSLLK